MTSKKDVGKIEDLIFALQNLVAIENHATISYLTSKDEKWLDVLNMTRRDRVKLLDKITKKENSHVYCTSKHLLAVITGLCEVGNRYLNSGEKELAKELFEMAGNYQALFLLLNDYTKEDKK